MPKNKQIENEGLTYNHVSYPLIKIGDDRFAPLSLAVAIGNRPDDKEGKALENTIHSFLPDEVFGYKEEKDIHKYIKEHIC